MPVAQSSTRPGSVVEVRIDLRQAAELYDRSGASAYSISQEQFLDILRRVVSRTEEVTGATPEEIAAFLSSLRIDELALAHGCVGGDQHAWDVFLTRYRESIYQSARSITRSESIGRELADSLYAELYGLGPPEERRSKLALYSGRGSLAGWLRMVLAQSYVNQIRTGKRLVSIEEEEEEHGMQFAAAETVAPAQIDARVKESVDMILASVSVEERFLLSSYFLDGCRLAEIGHMLGVHESTISRKLEKLLKELRKRTRKELERRGMSRRQAQEAMEADVRDLGLDVRSRLQPPRQNSS
ncbi:MAG TPA: sigma-70 family RNA polymerase sigma factor [Terriglobales bacterium]|nr:sigma-70 family RNA polymerase sigma factor [Terriglobales bacterium]